MDRKDLKIQALLEKISSLTTNYENQVADLRVELTISEQDNDELKVRIKELEDPDVEETEEKDTK